MEESDSPPEEIQRDDFIVEDVRPTPPTALELYNRGAPLWTPTILKDVKGQIDENVKVFVTHSINGERCVRFNYAFRDPVDRQTKVVFLGYRHLLDPQTEKSISDRIKYGSYIIHQFSLSDPMIPHPVPRYTFDELREGFRKSTKLWNDHYNCNTLLEALSNLDMDMLRTINKIICFGLGNDLAENLEGWSLHPAARGIRWFIGQKTGRFPALVTHSPDYTSDTKAALTYFGFTVVGQNGVDGFVEVDENSLVFACSSDIPVNQVLAELPRPAVIITRAFNEADLNWVCPEHTPIVSGLTLGMHDQFDPDTPRTKAMFADYDATPLWKASGVMAPRLWRLWLETEMNLYVRKKDYKPKELKADFESWFQMYD